MGFKEKCADTETWTVLGGKEVCLGEGAADMCPLDLTCLSFLGCWGQMEQDEEVGQGGVVVRGSNEKMRAETFLQGISLLDLICMPDNEIPRGNVLTSSSHPLPLPTFPPHPTISPHRPRS